MTTLLQRHKSQATRRAEWQRQEATHRRGNLWLVWETDVTENQERGARRVAVLESILNGREFRLTNEDEWDPYIAPGPDLFRVRWEVDEEEWAEEITSNRWVAWNIVRKCVSDDLDFLLSRWDEAADTWLLFDLAEL